jgi:FkbM family methyltransferase
MSNFLKKLLGKDFYINLKYSRLFSLYENIFKPGNVERQKKEIALYKSFLPDCNLVFDIGANDGHKTAAFLTLSKKVVCCEPDPENYKLLSLRFRNQRDKVVLVNKAVSDENRQAIFYVHHGGSAFNTTNKKWAELLEKQGQHYWKETIRFQSEQTVELVTVDTLIQQHGKPDFIKIDVEGSELQVLSGLSQKIKWITFESFLPDFKNELLGCINRLMELDPNTEYNLIVDEKILLEKFLTVTQLLEWLENSNLTAFEVLASTK